MPTQPGIKIKNEPKSNAGQYFVRQCHAPGKFFQVKKLSGRDTSRVLKKGFVVRSLRFEGMQGGKVEKTGSVSSEIH